MPVKVHQLAKQLEVSSKDIVAICRQNGIEVKSAQSALPDNVVPVLQQTVEMMLQLGSITKEAPKPAKKKSTRKKAAAKKKASRKSSARKDAPDDAGDIAVEDREAASADADDAESAAEEAPADHKDPAAQKKHDLQAPAQLLDPAEVAELRKKRRKKKRKKEKTADDKPVFEIHFQRAGATEEENVVPDGLFSVVGKVDIPETTEEVEQPKTPEEQFVEDEDEKAERIRSLLSSLGRNWEELPGIQKVRSLSNHPAMRRAQSPTHRRRRTRRRKSKRNLNESPYRGSAVSVTPPVTPRSLAEVLGIQVGIIRARLADMDREVEPNDVISDEEAQILAMEFEVELTVNRKEAAANIVKRLTEEADSPGSLRPRPPVVTIMGHVDHGKTTLLDYIRQTNIAEGEVGGITQHVSAYYIDVDGHKISFIDTPGHEAFTEMRSRGAEITDIVVLVVAADDGVMPQTEEAIRHARAAHVPIIVAVNKMDLPGANLDKVKQQLSQHNVIPEDWGGDVLFTPISALKGDGVKELLESILLQAEMMELSSNPDHPAQGYVLEARKSDVQGPMVDILVARGTLRPGAALVAGQVAGRVRNLYDWRGRSMDSAGPGMPVCVLGFTDVPAAGNTVVEFGSIDEARNIARGLADANQVRPAAAAEGPLTLEALTARLAANSTPELDLIVKTDVRGSTEAVIREIEKVAALTSDAKIEIIHSGVGAVNVSDVLLASTSGAIIIAFNVGMEGKARTEAEIKGVEIRTYRIIYELADDIRKALEGLLAPEERVSVIGHAEVRQVFDVSRVGRIAGCMVTDGRVERSARARILREGRIIHEAPLADLKRFKDDAREVREGFECGIRIQGYDDIVVGDVIEAYVVEKIDRKL
ncbi:MAG: translation initiation factor IF-2 [Planctomycetes bacterium]|nr:translation initiation factor IF-2 [Planctomycetota bacterium]